jgi:hypothetical protein
MSRSVECGLTAIKKSYGVGQHATTRRNFDHHVRLRSALLERYAALDMVLPSRVQLVYQRVFLS